MNSKLKEELKELQTGLSLEKKQKEDLQLCLIAQRKELEARSAVRRKKLEAEYQKQVDEMYFFSYRCCIKKNGIMRDIPSLPSDDEGDIPGGHPR